jgi:hypothetical protein
MPDTIWADLGIDAEQADELECRGRHWMLEIAKGNGRIAHKVTDEALTAIGPKAYEGTLLATPLASTGLSERVRRALEAERLRALTIGQALAIDPTRLYEMPMFGPAMYHELLNELLRYVVPRCVAAEERLAAANIGFNNGNGNGKIG